MKYLSRIEVLIADHAELARKSSDQGRMQALVDADPCAQGTCGHEHHSECPCGVMVPWVNGVYADGLGVYCSAECLTKHGEGPTDLCNDALCTKAGLHDAHRPIVMAGSIADFN